MRATFIAMLILLLPAALFASPTMGIYFTYTGGQMYISPAPFVAFDAYVYGHDIQCYLDASEFKVVYPPTVMQIGFDLPAGSLNLGDPASGISIAYWPPMDGWNPGYNLLCTIHYVTLATCPQMYNTPIQIIAHPDSGHLQGSCWPENNLFEYTGLTSIICPDQISVQTKTWGSIKSLF